MRMIPTVLTLNQRCPHHGEAQNRDHKQEQTKPILTWYLLNVAQVRPTSPSADCYNAEGTAPRSPPLHGTPATRQATMIGSGSISIITARGAGTLGISDIIGSRDDRLWPHVDYRLGVTDSPERGGLTAGMSPTSFPSPIPFISIARGLTVPSGTPRCVAVSD
jgi:hypothetical protein